MHNAKCIMHNYNFDLLQKHLSGVRLRKMYLSQRKTFYIIYSYFDNLQIEI